MNDLIDKRNERTRKRKAIKRKMDSVIGLSYDADKHSMSLSMNVSKLSDNSIRLLDEGYIDNGFVIKKGTLEKFLNGQNQLVRGWEFNGEEWEQTPVLNLTDDFTGTVNLGHMDFATFPYIIGEWNKTDLSLVDIENDRKGLDVSLRLDEGSIFVQELKRQPYDIGVSAEFWYHENEEDTDALSEMLGEYMPVIDEIFIFAYGLVGECGNVNSSGLELKKGEPEMKDNEEILKVEDEIEIPAQTAEEDTVEFEVEEPEEAVIDIEETVEETVEAEGAEEAAEVSEEDEVEETEEAEAEGEEDEVEEADLDEAADLISALNSQIESMTAEIEDLKAQNEALKKSNRKLNAKLKVEKEKKAEFLAKAKGISVKLNINEAIEEDKKVAVDYVNGDGIGE